MSQREQAAMSQGYEPGAVESTYLEYQRAYGDNHEQQAVDLSIQSPTYEITEEGPSSLWYPHTTRDEIGQHPAGRPSGLTTNSEVSPASRSPWDKISSIHHVRRENPKLALIRQNRLGSRGPDAAPSTAPASTLNLTSADEPNYTLDDGTPLARISDTIPCLYGPLKYVEGFDVINNFNNPVIVPEDDAGAPLFKKDMCGPRDSALLIVLMFAGVPAWDRPPVVFCWLEAFIPHMKDEKLLCYKADGTGVNGIELDFRSYGAMLGDWQRSQIYFNSGTNNHESICRWSKILDLLNARGIAIESVDHQLFMDLITDMTPDILVQKLDTLSNDFHSGRLASRRPRRKHRHVSEAFDYTEPDETLMDPNRLYTHRFSHAHPKGKLHDFKSDNVGGIFMDKSNATQDPKANKIDISPLVGKLKGISRWGRWTVISICALGIMAAVLLILYFRLGAKNKKGFTEH